MNVHLMNRTTNSIYKISNNEWNVPYIYLNKYFRLHALEITIWVVLHIQKYVGLVHLSNPTPPYGERTIS